MTEFLLLCWLKPVDVSDTIYTCCWPKNTFSWAPSLSLYRRDFHNQFCPFYCPWSVLFPTQHQTHGYKKRGPPGWVPSPKWPKTIWLHVEHIARLVRRLSCWTFACSTRGMPKSMEPEWFVGDVFFPDPAVHFFRSSGYVVAPWCTLEISHGNQQKCTTCQFWDKKTIMNHDEPQFIPLCAMGDFKLPNASDLWDWKHKPRKICHSFWQIHWVSRTSVPAGYS